MPRILRASLARNDLLDIWTHIAAESTPAIADNVLARLYGALEVLASAPYIGRERAEFADSPRSLAVRPYLLRTPDRRGRHRDLARVARRPAHGRPAAPAAWVRVAGVMPDKVGSEAG